MLGNQLDQQRYKTETRFATGPAGWGLFFFLPWSLFGVPGMSSDHVLVALHEQPPCLATLALQARARTQDPLINISRMRLSC